MKKKREEDLKQEREEIWVYGKMREVKISGDCDEEERAAAEEDYRSPVTEFWSERGSTEKREQRLKKRDSEGFFF